MARMTDSWRVVDLVDWLAVKLACSSVASKIEMTDSDSAAMMVVHLVV